MNNSSKKKKENTRVSIQYIYHTSDFFPFFIPEYFFSISTDYLYYSSAISHFQMNDPEPISRSLLLTGYSWLNAALFVRCDVDYTFCNTNAKSEGHI